MRPLEPLPSPAFAKSTPVANLITAIPSTAEYLQLRKYFNDYPERSYVLPICRALIYSMIRALRPRLVVEIGTLFAGTSEVFARALLENGNGRLITIDPYGSQRLPEILA